MRILNTLAVILLAAAFGCGSSDGTGGDDEGTVGPEGPQGIQGPAGPAGEEGPQGVAGEQGPQGDLGPQGDQGLSGADGVALTWLGTFDTAPTTPLANDAYYNSVDKIAYVYDGGDWQIIAMDGMDGAQGPQGIQGEQGDAGPQGAQGSQGADGISLTWLGAFVAAPAAPLENDAYYNSVDKVAYVFDGGLWQIIAMDGVDGAQGPPGVVGPQGDQGPQGDPGVSGTAGPQGPAGPVGPGGNTWGEEAASFAGFTTAIYNGDQGGREQMHAHCHAEFPGSHLCHVAEYYLTNSTTAVPVEGAWIDLSAGVSGYGIFATSSIANTLMGRYTENDHNNNCCNWTIYGDPYDEGLTITPAGPVTTRLCSQDTPLACCNSPFKETYVGATAATTTGDIGGRANAHFMCATEFPGSHMCHIAEYHRAHPTVSPPDTGLWLDNSAVLQMENGGVAAIWRAATVEAGRYTASDHNQNCSNWTIFGDPYDEGLTITPEGADFTTICGVARPVVCCE